MGFGEHALTVNLAGGTLVFAAVARLYVLPRFKEWSPQTILVPILLLHSQRHLGLMFLASGAVFPGMPAQFALPAAAGDLVAAVLAFLAIPLTRRDFDSAKRSRYSDRVGEHLSCASLHGVAYWIPAFWVPACW